MPRFARVSSGVEQPPKRPIDEAFLSVGLAIPSVMLPSPGADYTRWAVVACDQYTSEPQYWERVDRFVGRAPSTLRLILPECYLGADDQARREERILASMEELLERGALTERAPALVLVKRSTPRAQARWGIVASIDLERYDYSPGAKSLVRASEGTIVERLPPRMSVRRRAPIELPHIMVLYDDPGQTVAQPLIEAAESLPSLYDFDLMMGGGHLSGYEVSSGDLLERTAAALTRLADPARFRERHGAGSDVLLFAVGDGNHSLAAARAVWEETKRSARASALHPARFALVELTNLHDPGLIFEPIHRVVFGAGGELREALGASSRFRVGGALDFAALAREVRDPGAQGRFGVVGADSCRLAQANGPGLTVGTLQSFLDEFLSGHPRARIDYIHGEEVVERICRAGDSVGFLLPPIDKGEIFRAVVRDGVLPRKTFSMGEANEKRFYVEARRIR